MKRVLILANNDMGLYKFRKELIEELVKMYKVYIALPYGEYITELEKLGCEYIPVSLSRRGTNPISDFKLLIRYMKIIKKFKPDVVLTYTIKPNIYGGLVCRIYKAPYIVNITGLGSAVEQKGPLQLITLFLYRIALKKVNHVFFQNKENAEFLTKKISVDNYSILPGSGVNLKYYSLLDYPSDEQINFIFIGRIMKEKGIEEYLEAARYIRQKYPNTRFHVLGFCEEDYEDILLELQKKGIIQYHGMQRDIRKFLRKAHCTIHPSNYPEGISNVLLESAACGRPIITTDRSGCREVVDNGINGFLVRQKDSKDLIHKIEKFLSLSNEKKKEMGLAGRRKVEKEFDRRIVVNNYMQQIKLVMKNKDG